MRYVLILTLAIWATVSLAEKIDIKAIEKDYFELLERCNKVGGLIPVHMMSLIVNPEVYNEKCVSVMGNIHLEFESNWLFLDKEALNSYKITSSIDLNAYSRRIKLYELYNKKRVNVIGIINVQNLEKEKAFYRAQLVDFVVEPELVEIMSEN